MTITEALDALRDARAALYAASQRRANLQALRKLNPPRAAECAAEIDAARAAVDACVAQVQTLLIESPPVEGGLIVPETPPQPTDP